MYGSQHSSQLAPACITSHASKLVCTRLCSIAQGVEKAKHYYIQHVEPTQKDSIAAEAALQAANERLKDAREAAALAQAALREAEQQALAKETPEERVTRLRAEWQAAEQASKIAAQNASAAQRQAASKRTQAVKARAIADRAQKAAKRKAEQAVKVSTPTFA